MPEYVVALLYTMELAACAATAPREKAATTEKMFLIRIRSPFGFSVRIVGLCCFDVKGFFHILEFLACSRHGLLANCDSMSLSPTSRPELAANEWWGHALAWLDGLTQALLFAMIVFTPWAFGTTQPWSIHWMNVGGYALGAILVAKLTVRRLAKNSSSPVTNEASHAESRMVGPLTIALFVTALAILAYIFVSAINAEFTYVGNEYRQEPHPHTKWLPHSLDSAASWNVFWNWLALACVFWATHDWVASDLAPDGQRKPQRLRRLVLVLGINAALVALEGILQRNSGTPKLLWFMPTHDNPTAASQFGPYAYRSNAAQFFNLIWPVALGVWWQRHLQSSRRGQQHHWLLPSVMLLIAGALVSLSRAAAAVALLQVCACGFLFFARSRFSAASRLGIAIVFVATIGAASYFGWDELAQRLRGSAADPLGGRRETYQLAARMTEDYPWFGVGPGAFGSVFQFYRNSPDDYWPGQLHNDWLEYLITFGRAGCALLLIAAGIVAGRWFASDGVRTHWTFAAFVWIALTGCLLHARFDFPLQIYSIQFVFVLVCAILFSISRSERSGAGVS
jgi:O-antigen ligase